MAGTPEEQRIEFYQESIRDYLKHSPDEPGRITNVASFCS